MSAPTFNPKGVFFWGYLAGAAVCAACAWGPAVGVYAFVGLALALQVLG